MTRYLVSRRRFAFVFEPRDFWVGAFIGKEAFYLTPFPTLVLRFAYRPRRPAPTVPLGACDPTTARTTLEGA